MNGLIGYSGFVGQNLDGSEYDLRFNSNNSHELEGKSFDTLVCAGVSGYKTLANRFPENDKRAISELMGRLSNVKCNKFVLISTIDVMPENGGKFEDAELTQTGVHPYALHRIHMEEFVKRQFDNPTIIRLPGIFGKGLKKNFIFDLMFKIPRMFSRQEFDMLKEDLSTGEAKLLSDSYSVDENGTYCLKPNIDEDSLDKLREIVSAHNLTSLRFTDSRSIYAYYDLGCLREDLKKILSRNISLINIATEPIPASEIAQQAFGIEFKNEISGKDPVISYAKSKYADIWGNKDGYMYDKRCVLEQLKEFSAQHAANMEY